MCSCIIFLGQTVVVVTNFVITVIGLAVLAVGVLLKVLEDELKAFSALLPMKIIYIVLIVFGIVLCLIGLAGCIGACCKVRWSLILNGLGIAVLTAGKIYLLILIGQVLSESSQMFTDVLTGFLNSTSGNTTMQLIEYELKCCGVNGTDTYESAGLPVPLSCCDLNATTFAIPDLYDNIETTESTEPTCSFYPDGCVSVLTAYFDDYLSPVKTGLIIIIGVEVVTIVFDFIIAFFGMSNKK